MFAGCWPILPIHYPAIQDLDMQQAPFQEIGYRMALRVEAEA
jgi:hypothetical protein